MISEDSKRTVKKPKILSRSSQSIKISKNSKGSVVLQFSLMALIIIFSRCLIFSRVSELLRRTAEHALKDMILLLFMRLPQFVEDEQTFNIKCLQIRPEDTTKKSKSKSNVEDSQNTENENLEQKPEDQTVPQETERLIENKEEQVSGEETATEESESSLPEPADRNNANVVDVKNSANDDYINSVGVRFTNSSDLENSLAPYGIPCIRELFRFLISLCNPWDTQNTDAIMHIALNLLTIVFEVSADNLGNYSSLICLVKDDLCRNLIGVSV